MNSKIAEIKNNLEGINSKLINKEEQISEMEERVLKIISTEKRKNWGESKRLL